MSFLVINELLSQSHWYTDPQWWAIVIALFLGVVGIFQDWIRAQFRKPKLDISISTEMPYFHKTSFFQNEVDRKVCDTYYLRFKVENTGNYFAEDVEAMITKVYKKNNGTYAVIGNFLPLNLKWSHYNSVTIPTIQPGLFKHLDFGHILESKAEYLHRFGHTQNNSSIFFEFDFQVRPNNGSHIIFPGEYKIIISFAGNNIIPIEKTYYINIANRWTDEVTEMSSYVAISQHPNAAALRAIEKLTEDEAVNSVLSAENEPTLRDDIHKLMKKIK